MKHLIIIIGFLCFGIGYGQKPTSNLHGKKTIKSLKNQEKIYVSDISTTHLIFKEKIKYIDIGSPFFIADTIQSIVKVKHTGMGENQGHLSTRSNLTVITNSGEFYSIPLEYYRDIRVFSYKVDSSKHNIDVVTAGYNQKKSMTDKLDRLCDQFVGVQSNIVLKNERDDIKLKVSGIFYKNDHIAVRLDVSNHATINLDIDNILIRSKLKKKVASDYIYQEKIIKPLKICDKNYLIKGGSSVSMTLIFDKFTTNQNEKLFIDIFERNGGRSCTVGIPRKKLLNPKKI